MLYWPSELIYSRGKGKIITADHHQHHNHHDQHRYCHRHRYHHGMIIMITSSSTLFIDKNSGYIHLYQKSVVDRQSKIWNLKLKTTICCVIYSLEFKYTAHGIF